MSNGIILLQHSVHLTSSIPHQNLWLIALLTKTCQQNYRWQVEFSKMKRLKSTYSRNLTTV